MKAKLTKLIALLLAILMLTSLCACGANDSSPTTDDNSSASGTQDDSTSGTEGNDPTGTTNGNDPTGTTNGNDPVVPEDPNSINCYFDYLNQYYYLQEKPAFTIKVSSSLIAEGYSWLRDPSGNVSPFSIDEITFVTDDIFEKVGASYYTSSNCGKVLGLVRDSENLQIVSIGFINRYGYETLMEEGDSISSYTAASGHTYTQYSSHGRTCYILDLGLENCWVHIEQLLGGSGTEFETVTFEVIKN